MGLVNDIVELKKLKKWVISLALVSLCIAGLVLVLSVLTVSESGWETQGAAKALVVGFCVAIIFGVFAIITINYYRQPDEKSLIVIFKLLAVVYILQGIMACVLVFLPAY